MRPVMILVVAAAVAIAAVFASAAAGATAQAQVRICGQIKNGPLNDWALPRSAARKLGLPTRFRGRTWTVLARGTSCSFAMKNARSVLRRWATTAAGGGLIIRGHGVKGYVCAKERTPPGGRGHPGGQCLFLGIGRRFAFYELGSLSLAQIKRFAANGRLPVR